MDEKRERLRFEREQMLLRDKRVKHIDDLARELAQENVNEKRGV